MGLEKNRMISPKKLIHMGLKNLKNAFALKGKHKRNHENVPSIEELINGFDDIWAGINYGKTENNSSIEDLMKEFDIEWDCRSYYTPNFKTVQSLETLDLRDKDAARDYITYEVNKKYLNYCKKNETKPKEMISIPEHFGNTCNLMMIEGFDKDIINKFINVCINKYIDGEEVFTTCYDKHISEAYMDIKSITRQMILGSNVNYDMLIPMYKNFDNQFKFEKIAIQNIEKGKDYNEVLNNLANQIKIAEIIINSVIPQECLAQPNIVINDDACMKFGNGRYREFYDVDEDKIVISSSSDFCGVLHEYIHSVIRNDNKIGHVEWDYIYEIAKGNPICIYRRNGDSGEKFQYKFIGRDKFRYLIDPYLTKMPNLGFECYSMDCEFLSSIIDVLADENITLKNDKLINTKTGMECSAKEIFAKGFNWLCKEDPKSAALVLTFFRGRFKLNSDESA